MKISLHGPNTPAAGSGPADAQLHCTPCWITPLQSAPSLGTRALNPASEAEERSRVASDRHAYACWEGSVHTDGDGCGSCVIGRCVGYNGPGCGSG